MKNRAGSCLLVLGALLAQACTSDEPPPHQVYPDTGGAKRDGYKNFWPDTGTLYWDLGGKKVDRAATTIDGAVSDSSGPTVDGQPPNCPGPTAANCKSACPTDSSCTEAQGGTCVKTVVLSGSVSDKPVLVAVALAYVQCWAKAPSSTTLCFTFNTCGMTGLLTESAVSDWVCNKAQVTDFPSSTDYDSARGLCQCSIWQGQFVYRPEWSIGNVISGKKGDVCMSYHKYSWYEFDKINVGSCSGFPPP